MLTELHQLWMVNNYWDESDEYAIPRSWEIRVIRVQCPAQSYSHSAGRTTRKIFNEWNTRRVPKGSWCRSESAGTLTERRRQPVARFKPTALEDHLSAPFLLSFALVLHSLLFSSSIFFLQDFRVWTVNWWCKTNAFKRQRFSFRCCHAVRDEATRWRFTTIGSVYKRGCIQKSVTPAEFPSNQPKFTHRYGFVKTRFLAIRWSTKPTALLLIPCFLLHFYQFLSFFFLPSFFKLDHSCRLIHLDFIK